MNWSSIPMDRWISIYRALHLGQNGSRIGFRFLPVEDSISLYESTGQKGEFWMEPGNCLKSALDSKYRYSCQFHVTRWGWKYLYKNALRGIQPLFNGMTWQPDLSIQSFWGVRSFTGWRENLIIYFFLVVRFPEIQESRPEPVGFAISLSLILLITFTEEIHDPLIDLLEDFLGIVLIPLLFDRGIRFKITVIKE